MQANAVAASYATAATTNEGDEGADDEQAARKIRDPICHLWPACGHCVRCDDDVRHRHSRFRFCAGVPVLPKAVSMGILEWKTVM